MLQKKKISYADKESLIELDHFIKSNVVGTKHFRYFNKRPYTVINNHLYTSLYYNNNHLIGYGHLDEEDEKLYVGIMVSDNEVGKNYGNEIMLDLIKNSNRRLYCSVDILNERSLNLINKNGFTLVETKETYYIMVLEK